MTRRGLRVRSAAGSLITVVLAAACGGGEPAVATVTVRDSAGVRIVESAAVPAPWDRALAASPEVVIGTLEGPEEEQLFRVQDATLLPDGRIAVVNAGTREVRVFGPDGRHRATWGGAGEGPGEFSGPSFLVPWEGDSVGVWDGRPRRITVFGSDGTPGRTIALPPVRGIEGLEGAMLDHRQPDGTLVVSRPQLGTPDPGAAGGAVRPPVRYARVSLEGETLADLGEHPGDEAYMNVGDGFIEIFRSEAGRRHMVRPAGAEILLGSTDRLELRYFDGDGGLRRIARVLEAPRLSTDADQSAELEARISDAPAERHPAIRRSFELNPLPDTLPAYSTAEVDPLGRTWVRRFRLRSDPEPAAWIVFGPDGAALGVVEMPVTLDVYEIGADHVLGRHEDELGVEYVQLWRLRPDERSQ